MNFLDESGLKNLWAKIKASFSTAIVKNSSYSDNRDDQGRINIPFVASHQIVAMNTSSSINVYDWYKDAPEGGILEIVFTGTSGGYTYCIHHGTSLIFKMVAVSRDPMLKRLDYLKTAYNTYARLIKSDRRLIVVEFVENEQ